MSRMLSALWKRRWCLAHKRIYSSNVRYNGIAIHFMPIWRYSKQWDWCKNGNSVWNEGRKQQQQKNEKFQCAKKQHTHRAHQHGGSPKLMQRALSVLSLDSSVHSNCRKYIYNKRYSWRGNRTDANEMVLYHRPFIDLSQSIHRIHTAASHPTVCCWYYALMAQMFFKMLQIWRFFLACSSINLYGIVNYTIWWVKRNNVEIPFEPFTPPHIQCTIKKIPYAYV